MSSTKYQFIKKIGSENKFYDFLVKPTSTGSYSVSKNYGGFKKDGVTKNTGTKVTVGTLSTLEKVEEYLSKEFKKLATKGYISLEESKKTGDTYLKRPNQTSLLPMLPKSTLPKKKNIQDFIDDEDWLFQVKRDGNHAIIPILENGKIIAAPKYHNRKGQAVDIPDGAESLLSNLSKAFGDTHIVDLIETGASNGGHSNLALNGELVFVDSAGDHRTNDQADETAIPKLIIFDIIGPQLSCVQRLSYAIEIVAALSLCNELDPHIEVVETAKEKESKKKLLELVTNLSLEGLVLKRKAANYEQGKSSNSLKYKFTETDEFIVVGYTESDSGERLNRGYIGALALAQGKGRQSSGRKKIVPKGLVGGGFSFPDLDKLLNKFSKVSTLPNSPDNLTDKDYGKTNGSIKWLKDEDRFVVEVKYCGLTEYGIPFNPTFVDFRNDKDVEDC